MKTARNRGRCAAAIALCGMVLALGSLATADDLQTLDGKLYQGVKVTRVEPDGITVTYAGGIAKLKFQNLPEAVRKQYGYDATAASRYEAEQQQRVAQRQAEQAAMQRQREEQARGQQKPQAVAGSTEGGNTISIVLTPAAKGKNFPAVLSTPEKLATILGHVKAGVESKGFRVVAGSARFILTLNFSADVTDRGGRYTGRVTTIPTRSGVTTVDVLSPTYYSVTLHAYLTKGDKTIWQTRVSDGNVVSNVRGEGGENNAPKNYRKGGEWTYLTDPFDRLCNRLPACTTVR